MFIIAVLKKIEKANIEQNYRSALSALLRESLSMRPEPVSLLLKFLKIENKKSIGTSD
jgi:hypothetical protein